MASKTPTITIEYLSKRSSDKSATKQQDDEFVHAVCALANSEDGRIILRAKENEGYSETDADDITRKLEQKTSNVFGFLTAKKTISQEKVTDGLETSQLIFSVQAWPSSQQPCTVNYNFYLATDSQVKLVESSETVQSVIEFAEKKRNPKGVFEFGSHHRSFPIGETIPLRKSENTHLKCLKDEETETCNLVTRMCRKNNLTSCVSALANGEGGHIYYGIKLLKDGSNVVEGQAVKNKDTIVCGVEEIIKKMLWAKDYNEPRRGEHWQIFFEPVSGADEKCNLFVIVIAIAPWPLVFVAEPESYQLTDGQVTQLSNTEWEKRFRRHQISPRSPIVEMRPLQTCKCRSSEAERRRHGHAVYKLTQSRNQGDGKFLTQIKEYRQSIAIDDNSSNLEIILQHQEAADCLRKRNFKEAKKKLTGNKRYVENCKDPTIYEFRRLYWLCIVTRSIGEDVELKESDEHSSHAIELAESIPPMLMEAWLLVDKAKKLEIEIATAYDPKEPQNCDGLIKQCVDIYYKAIGKADAAQDANYGLVNLKQRVHISLARIFLGSFQNQGKIMRTAAWKLGDLDKAAEMLNIVMDGWRRRQGRTMTQFCKCEYHLARCEQQIRNWERFKKQDYFDEARENSKKALKIAKDNKFNNLHSYALGQDTYLDAELKS